MISSRYQNNSLPILDLNELQMKMKLQIDEKVESGHYLFEEVNCPICDIRNFQDLANKDRYGLYCQNVVCKNCGLVLVNPRMTEKSYNEFYNEEYRKLYTGVASNAANFFKAQNDRGRRLLDYLSTYGLVPDSFDSPPFVLEVGCGAGGILNYFRNQGFKVKGIDLGEEYLSYGKNEHNLDLEVGTLATLKLSTKPDLVIYSHVLEHVLDLNHELELLKSILGSDTLIYVEVPGLKNLASGYRNDPLRYFQNAHTFSFCKTSLGNLFAKHNFEMLQGNEFVKAVFKMSDTDVKKFPNDFNSIIAFLEKAEAARKYYFISFARMKMVMAAVVDRMGKVFS